ncbi:MAG: YceI family protein, partial [Chloroflexia bacterium]|nr:YceI family protein [Chloroflexia bacterium]
MRLQMIMIVLLAGLLAACGSAPAAAPVATEAPVAVATTPPTAAPAATTPVEPTAQSDATTPTEEPATSAAPEVQLFRIDAASSEVTYEVGEVFLNQGNRYALAVGRTQQINGEIELDRANPQNSMVGPIEIDISAFASDSPRRDNAIRDRWLESARFPLATFVPTMIEGLPEQYTDGEELTLMITGDLTVRDVTNSVTFTVTSQLDGSQLIGNASGEVNMTDFGFDPPDIIGVLRAEDKVLIGFRFVANAD